jgi:hypothetical protein
VDQEIDQMAHSAKFALRGGCAALALMAVAGCAVQPPSGPSAMAMPPAGKSYEQFTAEDNYCRQVAANRVGPGPSEQQSTNNVVGSAVVGTALGAAAGAALGSLGGNVGAGAVAGGVVGAATGTAVGANGAQATANGMQRTYDTVYTQCMVAKGNTVQMAPQPMYAEPGPYGYYYRPRYYYSW